jgi:molybdate transport system substrate-binding protein
MRRSTRQHHTTQARTARVRWRPALLAGCLVLALAGCGSSSAATTTSNAKPVTLTVLAAASLAGAFGQESTSFHAKYPSDTLDITFNGSNTLEQQLEQGASGDVFASADTKTMDKAKTAGLLGASGSTPFAHNRLVVIVPKGNPAHIATLQDLTRPGLKIDVAAPAVPVGNYTLQVLAKMSTTADFGAGYAAAVKANFVSQEQAVTNIVQKVALDEADAGFVYTTDASNDKSHLDEIAIPDALNVIATYPIAVLKGSANATEAQKFVDFVLSAQGQAILSAYGFGTAS